MIDCIPKHLHLWFSKSLMNFAGTAHQLHRQQLCSSSICRCCLSEQELDTLHCLDCTHALFVEYKRHLFTRLQQQVLELTDNDLTPLLLLDSMLNTEFCPIPTLPDHINSDLQHFGRRNMWHGIFPVSLSSWVLQTHRKDAWLHKFSHKCVSTLHDIWTERCAIIHESTKETIRVEDHETLQHNVTHILQSQTDLSPNLLRFKDKVSIMSSEQLRAFLYEFYALTQDSESHHLLRNHTLHSTTYYRPDITEAAFERRNSATHKRYQGLRSSCL